MVTCKVCHQVKNSSELWIDEQGYADRLCIECCRRARQYLKLLALVCWQNMLDACYNPGDAQYAEYHGKGVGICKRWRKSFDLFFADMGLPPPRGILRRRDKSGDFAPSNCYWGTDPGVALGLGAEAVRWLSFGTAGNLRGVPAKSHDVRH